MIDKRFIFVFCLVFFANVKIIYSCSCEPFNIENVICKSNFSLLVIAKGVGPQSKTHDSYYVEIRQSYNLDYQSAKSFRDYGSGIVYTTRKFTSCALRIKSNELYLIFGHLNYRNQPTISFCTTIKYDTLSDEERMSLNMISIKGINCKNVLK